MTEIVVKMLESSSFMDAQRVIGDMMGFNTGADLTYSIDVYGYIAAEATWDVPAERVADFLINRSRPAISSIVSDGRQLA